MFETKTCSECLGSGGDYSTCYGCDGRGYHVIKPDLEKMTPEDLGKRWLKFCNSHDYLVDCADIGDERIYSCQKELDAIEEEFKRRGLRSWDYTLKDAI